MHTQQSPLPLSRTDGLISLGLTTLGSAAYIRTLYPGVLPNDGAEFQALATLLGVAHTTGYSVYLIAARLVAFLPIQSMAYRITLFSALMAGLTLGLVYLLCVLATRSRWGAALAAVSLGLGSTFWSQAVIAEVYTPASAWLAAILLLVLAWYRSRRAGWLFWAGLLGGLSLGVHGSVGLAAGAVGLLILLSRPALKQVLPAALGGALLGTALMAATFFALDANPAPVGIFDSGYRPAISAWDRSEADIATPVQRLVFEITAVQWRPAMFSNPSEVMPAKAKLYAASLVKDFAWPVLALMALGLVGLLAADWRMGLFTLAAYLSHNLYTFNYNIGDNYVFYIPGYVYTGILAAAGTATLSSWVARLAGPAPARRAAAAAGVGLALLGAAIQPFAAPRLEMLRAGEAVFAFTGIPTPAETITWYRTIRATVEQMEPNAIGYIGWNDLFAYTYAARVDLGRSDLLFIEPIPYSKKGGMAASMLAFIRANLDKRPQYFQWIVEPVTNAGIRLFARDVGPTRLFRAGSRN